MRLFIVTILLFFTVALLGQNKLNIKVMVNGTSSFKKAFLFFPLLNDTISIDAFGYLSFDTSNTKRKLFYCVLNDEKSKIYNLNANHLLDTTVNFKIPDKDFFDNLYKLKVCPWCNKKDNVISFVYGKPSKALIRLADKGLVKLAGCTLSNTSPYYYCKKDDLEF